MLTILIVQLNKNYLWQLYLDGKYIARSTKIEPLEVIEVEVKKLCKLWDCKYWINERS